MTKASENGSPSKRRRRGETTPLSWKPVPQSAHMTSALFVSPAPVPLNDQSLRPAPFVVPDEPAARPVPLLTSTVKDSLRAVFKALNIDPRALNKLFSMEVLQGELPTIKPPLALVRRVIDALAPLVHPAEPAKLKHLFDNREHSHTSEQAKLVANVVAAMKATKRGTIARRYIRSVLCGSMTRAEVNRLLGNDEHPATLEEDSDDAREDPLKMTCKTFSRARRDWDILIECGELQPAKYGRTKVQDKALRHLLSFLFSPENIVLVSNCGLRIVVEDKPISLPAVMVSKNGSLLHQEYCKSLDVSTSNPLSRGSFYTVLNVLTRKELKPPMTIDNHARALVKDPLTLLRDLVIRLFPYEHRASVLKDVDKAEWFLMHAFAESHLASDNLGFHDITFALESPPLTNELEPAPTRTVQCRGCVFPFFVIERILKLVPPADADAVMKTITTCRHNFMFYMQYLTRKTAQHRALEDAAHEIRSNRLHNRLLIVMNYIDAFSPTGKEGRIPIIEDASLHGATVFYLQGRKNHESNIEDLNCVFYDHFVTCDPAHRNEHEFVTGCIIEALLHRVRSDFPNADEAVFITDNSKGYKNFFFPSFLPHISREYGFRAVRLIYSCSQMAEILLDTHFEHLMKIIKSWQNGDSLPLIKQTIDLIDSESELRDTSAEHLLLDFECQEFCERVKFIKSQGSDFATLNDFNDIIYEDLQEPEAEKSDDAQFFKARVYEYGGIGDGNIVDVNNCLYQNLGKRRHMYGSDLAPTVEEENTSSHNHIDNHGNTPGIGAPEFTIFTQRDEDQGTALLTSNENTNVKQERELNAISEEISREAVSTITSAVATFGSNAQKAGNGYGCFQWLGAITHVQVVAMSGSLNVKELRVSAHPNGVTGGLVADSISRIHAAGLNRYSTDEKNDRDEASSKALNKSGIAGRSCRDCNRSFKSERFLQSHNCKGAPVDKDVSARAVVLASEMYGNRELCAFSDPAAYLWSGSFLCDSEEPRDSSVVEHGWGRTPTPSGMVESNIMLQYKAEVFQLLDENKGKDDIHFCVPRHRLVKKYSDRNDIPSIKVIEDWCMLRKASWKIQPFCQIGLDGTSVVAYEDDADMAGGKARMKSRYVAKITEMHEQQLDMDEGIRPKPRHMFKEFAEFFKDEQGRFPPDFPSQKQVMNKINALRSRSKQRSELRSGNS